MPALAQVTLSPATVSFGNVALGQTSGTKNVVLTNAQSVPLTISSIAIAGTNAGDFASGGNCPISPNTLGAGSTCNVTLSMTPSALGSRTAALTVSDNASNSPQSVALAGAGIAPVALAPTSLNFGNQVEGTTSAAKTVTLKNAQQTPLVISSIGFSGAAAGDYAWGGNCPISPNTLAFGQSCSITVTFTPLGSGSRNASLIITDNAFGSPQLVALSGTGAVAVSVNPASLSFSSFEVGTTSPAKTVNLINHLPTQLLFSSISSSGDFAVASNTCGAGISAGATCSLGVTFTPTALGSRIGTLTISDNAVGSPLLVALSGTGNDSGLTSITVTPANASIATGSTQQYTATGNFKTGSMTNLTAYVTWVSSAPAVATVSPGGLASAVTVGSSNISANLGSVTGSAVLTTTPSLVSIAVTPADASIVSGGTQQFVATGTYSDSSTQNLTGTVTWSSSAATVATISNTAGSQGLASALTAGTTTITAISGTISGSTALSATGFAQSGNLNTARFNHTATLLTNGTALIAGGIDGNGNILSTNELYSMTGNTFSFTGSLNTARSYHTATLLNNGMVLIVGGAGSGGSVLASAELYNPTSGSFSATGNLNAPRYHHTATLLGNGMVLIAGGEDASGNALSSAELYNPATAAFTTTGNLITARFYHTATLLNNGSVLIAGGEAPPQSCGNPPCNAVAMAAAELYNPSTASFTPTGSLSNARAFHTATLLNNANVVFAGGLDNNGNVLGSAELYSPAGGTFTITGSLSTARYFHAATLLNNGTVLITGGSSGSTSYLSSAELYDPVAVTFSNGANLNIARDTQTSTLLSSGMVLITGGTGATGAVAGSELYQPATTAPPNLMSIAITPAIATVAVSAWQQLVATGTFSDSSSQQLASANWTSSNQAVISITNDDSDAGSAYATGIGTATVSACTGSICGTSAVTVSPPTVVSISVTPANSTVQAGLSVQFDAMGTYSDGSTQDITSAVTWNSSVPSVATVTAGGLATTATTGVLSVSATLGSISSSTSLTVNTTQVLPNGSMSAITPETCPATVNGSGAGWVTNTSGGSDIVATCYHATVSCPDMPDLGVTYGVSTPTGTSKGTVAFMSAKGGTTTLPGVYANEAPFDLFHFGFQVVQFGWDSSWQAGSSVGSLKQAACREATFLNYVYTQFYQTNVNNSPTAGMCAHSQSGGAAGLAFAFTFYGASNYIDKAVYVSGPHYSDMVQGCSVPNASDVTVCQSENGVYPMGCNSLSESWTDPPEYTGGAAAQLTQQLADNPACNDPTHTYTAQDNANLTATSLLDGTPDANFNYPHTAVTAWECDDDYYWENPSEGQGWLYFSQLRDPSQVAPNCNYSNKNTAFPNACMVLNRVYGCKSVELAATGFVCNGSTCPVCTGTPATNCTCGGVPCSSVSTSYGMPTFRDEEYEDPINGCIKRH